MTIEITNLNDIFAVLAFGKKGTKFPVMKIKLVIGVCREITKGTFKSTVK